MRYKTETPSPASGATEVRVWPDGYRAWHRNGQLHRDDGPAVEGPTVGRVWYCNGQLHHEAGPAHEGANRYRAWWRNGQLHRENGPAIEQPNGSRAWWLRGVHYEGETEWRAALSAARGGCQVTSAAYTPALPERLELCRLTSADYDHWGIRDTADHERLVAVTPKRRGTFDPEFFEASKTPLGELVRRYNAHAVLVEACETLVRELDSVWASLGQVNPNGYAEQGRSAFSAARGGK